MATKNSGRNIVLIGMRGCGKTTVARILSKKTGKKYLELNELLVEKVGMKISDIVSKYGWLYFRDQEAAIVKEAAQEQNKIISTGGGVILLLENITALKQNGIFVYLQCSVDMLLQRVGVDPNRPALTDKGTQREEMADLLTQREDLYKQYADIIIKADDSDADEQAAQILGMIGKDVI